MHKSKITIFTVFIAITVILTGCIKSTPEDNDDVAIHKSSNDTSTKENLPVLLSDNSESDLDRYNVIEDKETLAYSLTKSDNREGWIKYRNEELGIEVEYPNEWTGLFENFNNSGDKTFHIKTGHVDEKYLEKMEADGAVFSIGKSKFELDNNYMTGPQIDTNLDHYFLGGGDIRETIFQNRFAMYSEDSDWSDRDNLNYNLWSMNVENGDDDFYQFIYWIFGPRVEKFDKQMKSILDTVVFLEDL